MSQENKLEDLCDKSIVKNILYDIPKDNSNMEQIQGNKEFSNITGKKILENPLYPLHIGISEYFRNLVDLNLSKNQLIDLPDSLKLLKNLVYLSLNDNNLQSLPNAVCELTNLKKLWVCNNQIKQVNSQFANLFNLEVLNFNKNQLTDLPNSCAKLNQLQVCNLTDNKFKKIPNCISKGMTGLQILEFSHNPCAELNVYPKSTELIMFFAEENNCCPSFPKWILSSRYKKLEIVLLNNTRFKRFDLSKRSSISSIKKLSMKQCCLEMNIVEIIITGMVNLQSLIISNDQNSDQNYFKNMPKKKRLLTHEEIDISDTSLPMIPKIINEFTNLSEINISSNNVYHLPEEICSLINLDRLIISKNYLTKLPEKIGELKSLKSLIVQQNCLNRLPESVMSLNNLEYMDLYDNELEGLPEVILNLPNLKGLDLEQNYFSTEYLRYLRVPNYEVMRANLRTVWPNLLFGSESPCGCKSKLHMNDKHSHQGSELSSSNSTSSNSSGEEHYMCTLASTTYNELLNDRWDTSEDSADEFDPHMSKEPKKRLYPPFTFYKPFQRVYCPAESHQPRVITRITGMLKNGSLVWTTNYEEGQFEDP